MTDIYIIRSNQYARMSEAFYSDYLAARNTHDKIDGVFSPTEAPVENAAYKLAYTEQMDDAAIAAIVFQALAIEAYVNLMGAYLIGEEVFYKRHERKSTFEKLDIVLQEIGGSLSADLKERIALLFKKRNRFVHQKPKAYHLEPKPYDYKNPEANFNEINEFFREITFSYENIDMEIHIYAELQESIRILRRAEYELIEEIQSKTINDGFASLT